MSDDLDRARRLTRRRMAQAAFASILAQSWAVVAAALYGHAEALAVASPVLGPLVAAQVAVVMSYLGASAYEAAKRAP